MSHELHLHPQGYLSVKCPKLTLPAVYPTPASFSRTVVLPFTIIYTEILNSTLNGSCFLPLYTYQSSRFHSPYPTPSQDQVTILTIQESHWLPGLPSVLPKSLPLPTFNLHIHKFKQVPSHKPFRESITYRAMFQFFGKVHEAHQ